MVEKTRDFFLASLLEAVANGSLEPEAALAEWGDPGPERNDRTLSGAWHVLSHYADDGDIRLADEGYARHAQEVLRRQATKIRLR
jgi:hypothetical protein